MDITCISDLHGFCPSLEGGDLLIVAGDLTARETEEDYVLFFRWLNHQKYKKVIVVGGNHDTMLDNGVTWTLLNEIEDSCTYLLDEGTEFEGLKIWGSPWIKTFEGINPKCTAFTLQSEEALDKKWSLIPSDTDILVTHCPPHSILDSDYHYGSFSLYDRFYSERIKPKLHVFGHIHEGYGHIPNMMDMPYTQFVNASIMDESYTPINKPIRIIL